MGPSTLVQILYIVLEVDIVVIVIVAIVVIVIIIVRDSQCLERVIVYRSLRSAPLDYWSPS